jgi:transcriptional regulator with XRE-family HTH domain
LRQDDNADYRWRVSADEERFASNLKLMREEAGLTQAALAREMTRSGYRWHQATVYKVENGERQIQLGEAREVARIFGTRLDDMLVAPAGGRVERQLEYDVNRYKHAFDRTAWQVVDFADARRALTQSLDAARSLASESAEMQTKIKAAELLLHSLTDEMAFETGSRAVSDVLDQPRPRAAFRERYALVKERVTPSPAESLAELDAMERKIAEPPYVYLPPDIDESDA